MTTASTVWPEPDPSVAGDPAVPGMSPEYFTEVIGHFASGVTVIATTVDGVDKGTTASAVTSLSAEPPMVLVCLNSASSTGRAVARVGTFTMNILGADHGPLAMRFASSLEDRFRDVRVERTAGGLPGLADALATLECEVAEIRTVGTHVVFFARVGGAAVRQGTPLAYFRGRFGRLQQDEDVAVYQGLRERLVDGSMPPGRDFTIGDLAGSLDVPVGPVFQAMRRLVDEGMVDKRGPDAYAVRLAPDAAVADLCRARADIELGVVCQTLGSIDEGQLDELRRLERAAAAEVAAGRIADLDGWLRADAAFHEAVVALAKSRFLRRAYRGLGVPAWDVARLGDLREGPALLADHRALIAALENADGGAASRAITGHAQRLIDAAAPVHLESED